MSPTLTTRRLVLRPARAEDLEAMHAVLSDARAMAYWSSAPHETRDESRAWLDSMIEAPAETSADFIVEMGGKVIGKAGFFRFPEIGFILISQVWGQGLGREAIAAVVDHAIQTRGQTEIMADVDPRNAAAIQVLETLGFVRSGTAERTYQIGETWTDSVYLTLDRAAWNGADIRHAQAADIPRLLPLIEGAYRGDSSRRGWTTEADLLGGQRTDAAMLAEIIADPNHTILLAEPEGKLAGCVLVAGRGDGLGYLGMLSVDPSRQAAGLGRRLASAAEATARGRFGADRMEMTVFWQRAELIAWYERLGYRRTGETRPFPMDNPRMGLPLRDDLWFEVLAKDLTGETP